MTKKIQKLPEPSFREQLYAYGFTDEDIDALNVIPLHRYLIKMNLNFSNSLKSDIVDMVKEVVMAQNAKLFRMDKKIDTKFKQIIMGQAKNSSQIEKIETRIEELETKVNQIVKEHIANHKKLVI
jgi:hypothetical protein